MCIRESSYSAQDNCRRLIAEVHGFAGTAPQSDDITVLAIRLSQESESATVQEKRDVDTPDRAG